MSHPSQFLPSLQSLPDSIAIQEALAKLLTSLANLDEFEKSFSRNYLVRLIAKSELYDSALIDNASSMLASMSGRSAAPSQNASHCIKIANSAFPGLDDTEITVEIRSDAFVEIGSVTWEAAPLMAKRLLNAPHLFIHETNILEIGSGTGLVGLAVAALLSRLRIQRSVTLSDYHPTVMANLKNNVHANQEICTGIPLHLKTIDWRELDDHHMYEYGLLIGSDLIYDFEQVQQVHKTVSHFLRPGGRFLLTMPLRQLILAEVEAVEKIFSASPFAITSQVDETIQNEKTEKEETFRFFEIERQ